MTILHWAHRSDIPFAESHSILNHWQIVVGEIHKLLLLNFFPQKERHCCQNGIVGANHFFSSCLLSQFKEAYSPNFQCFPQLFVVWNLSSNIHCFVWYNFAAEPSHTWTLSMDCFVVHMLDQNFYGYNTAWGIWLMSRALEIYLECYINVN